MSIQEAAIHNNAVTRVFNQWLVHVLIRTSSDPSTQLPGALMPMVLCTQTRAGNHDLISVARIQHDPTVPDKAQCPSYSRCTRYDKFNAAGQVVPTVTELAYLQDA